MNTIAQAVKENVPIISFSGVVGSGKNYQAELLTQYGYQVVAFADEVREVAWMLLGWAPANEVEYADFKEAAMSMTVGGKLIEVTGREFLINIGDGMRNRYGDDFWINKLEDKIIDYETGNPKGKFAIPDARYYNELDWVYNLGECFFCDYKSDRYNATIDNESEYMAQSFIKQGLKDLQRIRPEHWIKGVGV